MKRKTSNPPLSPADRQKRFLLIVPLLVFPFLTGGFWALAGGSGSEPAAASAGIIKGLDMSLPSPHFDKKETPLDKLGFYQKAALDSARRAEKERDDPYRGEKAATGLQNSQPYLALSASSGRNGTTSPFLPTAASVDPNEEKVNRKLEELKKIINQPQPPATAWPARTEPPVSAAFPSSQPAGSPDIERLEKLLQAARQTGDSSGRDPQLDRIDRLLDKVLKIQHPEIADPEHKPPLPATTPAATITPGPPADDTIRSLEGDHSGSLDTSRPAESTDDGFFAFDDDTQSSPAVESTIHAIVADDQTLVSGATVRLRLMEDVQVKGAVLQRDNFVYGTATLNNERLQITIKSILVDNTIYPVNWQVYDLDGMAGIFIPGSINRDVSKASAAEGINGMGLTTLDASLGAQAATAGIQAAKNLLSQKVKLVRVSLKAGHEVLIMQSKAIS